MIATLSTTNATRNTANSNADFENRIRQFFQEELQIDVGNSHSDLIKQGILDSFSLVELTTFLETECGADFELEELKIEDSRTISQIAEFVRSHS